MHNPHEHIVPQWGFEIRVKRSLWTPIKVILVHTICIHLLLLHSCLLKMSQNITLPEEPSSGPSIGAFFLRLTRKYSRSLCELGPGEGCTQERTVSLGKRRCLWKQQMLTTWESFKWLQGTTGWKICILKGHAYLTFCGIFTGKCVHLRISRIQKHTPGFNLRLQCGQSFQNLKVHHVNFPHHRFLCLAAVGFESITGSTLQNLAIWMCPSSIICITRIAEHVQKTIYTKFINEFNPCQVPKSHSEEPRESHFNNTNKFKSKDRWFWQWLVVFESWPAPCDRTCRYALPQLALASSGMQRTWPGCSSQLPAAWRGTCDYGSRLN